MMRGPTSSVTTSSASALARRRLFFHPRYSITSTSNLERRGGENDERPAWYHAGLSLGISSGHFAESRRTPSRHDPRVPSAITPRSKPAGAGTGLVVSGPPP